MRFDIRLKAELEMLGIAFPDPTSHPVQTTPVMFSLGLTLRYAVDAAAIGAKKLTVSDSPINFGDQFTNWLTPYAGGNINGTKEHYKNAHVVTSHEILVPGYYRFEVWGYSEADADPGIMGRIVMNYEGEPYALALRSRGQKGAQLEITPSVLR